MVNELIIGSMTLIVEEEVRDAAFAMYLTGGDVSCKQEQMTCAQMTLEENKKKLISHDLWSELSISKTLWMKIMPAYAVCVFYSCFFQKICVSGFRICLVCQRPTSGLYIEDLWQASIESKVKPEPETKEEEVNPCFKDTGRSAKSNSRKRVSYGLLGQGGILVYHAAESIWSVWEKVCRAVMQRAKVIHDKDKKKRSVSAKKAAKDKSGGAGKQAAVGKSGGAGKKEAKMYKWLESSLLFNATSSRLCIALSAAWVRRNTQIYASARFSCVRAGLNCSSTMRN